MNDAGATTVHRAGTSEESWLTWAGLARGPTWTPPQVPRGTKRVTVVAAHPDDETLAVGGVMQLFEAAGWDVDVVVVTDGEASHENWADGGADGLAATRRAEFAHAMRALGIGPRVVAQLGLPDSGLAELSDTLVDALTHYLGGSDLVLAPHPADGHADHDACGDAVAEWARAADVTALAYGVWLWEWVSPGALQYAWADAVRVALPPEVLERKCAAIEAYRSQLDARPGEDAMLSPAFVAHHVRDLELLFPLNGSVLMNGPAS